MKTIKVLLFLFLSCIALNFYTGITSVFASNYALSADSLFCDSIISHKLIGKYAGGSTTGTGQPLYYDSTLSYKKQYFKYTTNGQVAEHINLEEYANSDKDLKRVREYDNAGRCISEAVYSWNYTTKLWAGKTRFEQAFDSKGNKTLSILYVWDTTNKVWVNGTKTELTFDAAGQKTLEISYTWDTANSSWKGSQKNEYTYNENGFETLEIRSTWDATLNGWKGTNKTEQSYDSNGNELLSTAYVWNNTTGSWLAGQKSEYKYDIKGNMLLIESLMWFNNSWMVGAKLKGILTYNAAGNVALANYFAWDNQNNTWKTEPRYKIEYTYNSNNLLINEKTTGIEFSYAYMTGETKYDYDSKGRKIMTATFDGQSRGKQKTELAFDDNNNIILKAEYTWSTSTGNWQGSGKVEYAFDNLGNKTLEMSSSWDYSKNVWQYTGTKYEFAYDVNGNKTLNSWYYWDATTKTWKGNTKEVITYNAAGQKTIFIKYVWNATTSTWIESLKTDYTYNTNKLLTLELNSNYSTNKWVMDSRFVYSYTTANVLRMIQYDTYSKNFLYWHFIYRDKYFFTRRSFTNYQKQELLTLNAAQRNLAKGIYTTLIASVTPTNVLNRTVVWSTSNQNVASVDNTGKVTALENGTAIITAKTMDGILSASCTIVVGAPASTDIKNPHSKISVSIYPNPAKTQLIVSSGAIIQKVKLYSMQGLLLKEIHANSNIETIHLSDLPTNAYLLKCETSSGIISKTLFVEK